MQLIPYLQLNGKTKKAIAFYEQVFHAENLGVTTYSEMPPDMDSSFPEDAKDLVAQATLRIGESILMLADTFPGQPSEEGSRVIICVLFDDADEARKVFEALQENGEVLMPLTETEFSPAFGVIKDKFGVWFQFYTE